MRTVRENVRPTSKAAATRLPARTTTCDEDAASISPRKRQGHAMAFGTHANRGSVGGPPPQRARRWVVFLLVPAIAEPIRRRGRQAAHRTARWRAAGCPMQRSARRSHPSRQRVTAGLSAGKTRGTSRSSTARPSIADAQAGRPSVRCEIASADHQRERLGSSDESSRESGRTPGPRWSSPATPAVSGVSAQPSPRYQSGDSMTCQSISFGRPRQPAS